MRSWTVGIVEVGRLPVLEDPPGQVGRDQDLLGGAEAAHVDEHDVAIEQVTDHGAPPTDTLGSVAMQWRPMMRRARRWTTCKVLRAMRPFSSTSRKPGRSSRTAKLLSQPSPSTP